MLVDVDLPGAPWLPEEFAKIGKAIEVRNSNNRKIYRMI